jgi:hypothetical protein
LKRRGDLFILLKLPAKTRLITIFGESELSMGKKRVMDSNDNDMFMGALSQ